MRKSISLIGAASQAVKCCVMRHVLTFHASRFTSVTASPNFGRFVTKASLLTPGKRVRCPVPSPIR